MTEISEDLVRVVARELILSHAEDVEFMTIGEVMDADPRFEGLTEAGINAVQKRIDDAIGTATVTVTWPDRKGEADPDEQALLDILATGAHDGPALVAVLRSIDGGPDFPETIDAAECSTFIDRLLEWKNNAVAAASAASGLIDTTQEPPLVAQVNAARGRWWSSEVAVKNSGAQLLNPDDVLVEYYRAQGVLNFLEDQYVDGRNPAEAAAAKAGA